MLRDIWEVIRGRLSSASYEVQVSDKNFWRESYDKEHQLRITADKRARENALADITSGRAREESDAIAHKVISDIRAGFGWCPYCNKQTPHSEGACITCGDGIRVIKGSGRNRTKVATVKRDD